MLTGLNIDAAVLKVAETNYCTRVFNKDMVSSD